MKTIKTIITMITFSLFVYSTYSQNPDFIRVSNALINGTANRITADFAIHMTTDIFHIGDSRVNYETHCADGTCTTIFTAFIGDGFRDPLDIGIEVPYQEPSLSQFQYQIV
ncbi:hypothetical protein B6A10_16120 [Flavobacterium sp. L1I52]|uniref:Uncharacterized protein n=1 Tax=Flavobacterium pokkalii TaxID=1940408 RepID=A0ABR7UYJ5_9FLAO|nr:hypothetical protein [Flavobacterium pokkalii]MBD0726698.1 hypothetical protein [Flavobacterium pokkalii]